MKAISSRIVSGMVLVGAFCGGIGLSSSAFAEEKRFDGVTLRVATFGGYWQEQLHNLIGVQLEELGATVEYVTGTPRDNMARLIAGRGQAEPPFDVMEYTDSIRNDMSSSGVLAPLDYGNIPNAAPLLESQRLSDMVAHYVTIEGIVYNKEKFDELGLPVPDSFSALYDPKLAGHVSFPEMSYGGVINALIGLTNEFDGGDESNIDAGLAAVRELQPATFFRTSVDLSTQFQSGDIYAAIWHAGWAVRLRRAGLPLAVAYPKIKDKTGMIQLGWIGKIDGTRHSEAAEFFIDKYLSQDVQTAMLQPNGIVPVNPEAAEAMRANDELAAELMLLTPEEIEGAYYPDWSKISMSEWGAKWNREILQ